MAALDYDTTDTDPDAELAAASGAARPRRVDEMRGILERAGQVKRLGNLQITPKKVKLAELMHVSRQLAAFVRAGVPLVEAIDVIREETEDKTLGPTLDDVSASLREGKSLSDALHPHREAFPPHYLGVLRSAELTGRLDTVLDRLAVYLERDVEARRRIHGAIAYPIVVLLMCAISMVTLSVFVLPKFTDFFKSFDAELPLPTRMLLAAADFVERFGPFMPFLLLVVSLTYVLGIRTPKGRAMRDKAMLKVPVIGGIVRYAVIERFCRILASMVQAGVPLPESLAISATGAHNVVYERALARAREEMLNGDGLALPIARTDLFPRAVTQMLRVGEDTGTLDDQLESMARYYERELDHKIKRLSTLFEPAVMIVVGVIVGFVALAMVSALYGIYNQTDLK